MSEKNWKPQFSIVVLALVITALNGLKPLYMDDAAYYRYAAHISQHPLNPYGFEISPGLSANQVLAPPVMLYWWAIALHFFGPDEWALKLSLLPFVLLFLAALFRLFRRFTPGLELPLVTMTALSPAFLPAWNLMLDVPALALGLFAIAVFIEACTDNSLRKCICAGFVAGLAMQTKYTAFVVPVVFLTYACLVRKPRSGIVAASVAVLIFVAWEMTIAQLYGESHFVHSLHERDSGLVNRMMHLILPLIGILGGLTSALTVLGMRALAVPQVCVASVVSISVGGFLALTFTPESTATLWRDAESGKSILVLNALIFGALGLLGCVTFFAVIVRLWKEEPTESRTIAWFLTVWLALEISGYFALSPFAASRRVLGIVVVTTLIVGRLASRRTAREAWSAALGSAALGLCFWWIDWHEARAAQQATNDAVVWIRARDTKALIHFDGPWSFGHYARAAGARLHLPGAELPTGEWLIVPIQRCFEPLSVRNSERVAEFCIKDGIPLRTMPCFYDGRTAIEHHEGPRFVVAVVRGLPASAPPSQVDTALSVMTPEQTNHR